ncbi:hypothetical protein KM043_003083 [Ampulex compressa]|nr:hypothetical protein KM043_003083 [Ampulex compressa]
MSSLPPVYNDSLRFNQFDLRVITCGVFNKTKFFVAGIKNVSQCKKNKTILTVLELILIHAIYKDHGIFVKRHLQTYNNFHFLLLPSNVAKKVTDRWKESCKKSMFVIAFVKHKYYRSKHTQRDKFFFCEVLIPGNTVIISDNVSPLFYKEPAGTMQFDVNDVPLSLVEQLQCSRVIEVDRYHWKSSYLKAPYSRTARPVYVASVTKRENNEKKQNALGDKSKMVSATVSSQSTTVSSNTEQETSENDINFPPLEISDDIIEQCMESVMLDSDTPLSQLHSRGLYDEDFLLLSACTDEF